MTNFAPYRPGDILYVRETWAELYGELVYRADGEHPIEWNYHINRWRPPIHMPKEAARIFLRVTAVRVERLQDMTEEQARAEGILPPALSTDVDKPDDKKEWIEIGPALPGFIRFWGSIIKKADRALYGWEANPWVWVIEFERISKEEAV